MQKKKNRENLLFKFINWTKLVPCYDRFCQQDPSSRPLLENSCRRTIACPAGLAQPEKTKGLNSPRGKRSRDCRVHKFSTSLQEHLPARILPWAHLARSKLLQMPWQLSLATEPALAQLTAERFQRLVTEHVKAFYFANELCVSVLVTLSALLKWKLCCSITVNFYLDHLPKHFRSRWKEATTLKGDLNLWGRRFIFRLWLLLVQMIWQVELAVSQWINQRIMHWQSSIMLRHPLGNKTTTKLKGKETYVQRAILHMLSSSFKIQ